MTKSKDITKGGTHKTEFGYVHTYGRNPKIVSGFMDMKRVIKAFEKKGYRLIKENNNGLKRCLFFYYLLSYHNIFKAIFILK